MAVFFVFDGEAFKAEYFGQVFTGDAATFSEAWDATKEWLESVNEKFGG